MKKIIFSIATLAALTVSCVNESDDYNLDRDLPYSVPAGSLLTNAQKELADQMTTPSVNLNVFRYFSQYWAATQYTTETRYRIKTRNIPDNHWNNLYRDVLGNLETAKLAVNNEVKPSDVSTADWNIQQKNKLAIIEIQELYTYQILVDTFGDIPYTDALNPSIVLPKYDNDATIYPKLITRLNAALANLDDSGISFEQGDYIYNGDVHAWKLFANSLKVKLGINLADVDPALAKTTVETAYADGVIMTDADNAKFNYVVAAPNYNPIYANLVASGRNDFVPASTIVNAMNTLNDPRRAKYFTLFNGIYKGANYGYANAYINFSHISDNIKQPDAAGILFESTEMKFYLAEAAERGYNVGNTGEYYYNEAIRNSFTSWGLSTADADAYLLNPSVAYTTAAGTYKEKIGYQAWIAYFNRGFESWTTWRRLDAPVITAPASALPEAEGVVPKRYTYPVNEQTVNGANWQAASAAMGGDKLKNKVFWDVN
ncbi:SusD/RagB family nutrient-binding outer membrane lipoprotein [Flavobacterium sp. SM15]|uniref:SusD/RagB family nutrient-binding outer membrane lipoprotein n=1 Tax=Flavobacterium sp. SM15 TaxID=2908005 RepID=UPI001ED9DBFA|nr:SusD/RagB family nutrient-binding outer membrane lipoprotein [Flavobacterium sp. SM15]MCG2611351.1 SusD/RagB family nutrient-binding outer membrane lipoprotein [Flavobacterium sp. SM15]